MKNMEDIENTENMEKMENINQMTWNTWFMIQNTWFLNQNTFIVNQMTQNIQVYSIYGNGKKIITYALEKHDPGSAQDGRTSSEM